MSLDHEDKLENIYEALTKIKCTREINILLVVAQNQNVISSSLQRDNKNKNTILQPM